MLIDWPLIPLTQPLPQGGEEKEGREGEAFLLPSPCGAEEKEGLEEEAFLFLSPSGGEAR